MSDPSRRILLLECGDLGGELFEAAIRSGGAQEDGVLGAGLTQQAASLPRVGAVPSADQLRHDVPDLHSRPIPRGSSVHQYTWLPLRAFRRIEGGAEAERPTAQPKSGVGSFKRSTNAGTNALPCRPHNRFTTLSFTFASAFAFHARRIAP